MGDSSNVGNQMNKFKFSTSFNGITFYDKYKSALFLQVQNIRTILAKSDELQVRYDAMKPGETLEMEGMFQEADAPLVMKKSGLVDESDVEQDDFTMRRLTGLVAAVVIGRNMKDIYSVDADRLYIKYLDITNYNTRSYHCSQYLSAVPGTEYFANQFNYYPFICALRRFQLKQISEELLLNIANIRHPTNMHTLLSLCRLDFENAAKQALNIFNFDLKKAIDVAPESIKCYLFKQLNVNKTEKK